MSACPQPRSSGDRQHRAVLGGAQRWKDNVLSGGTAPASSKGFADSADPATAKCGDTWTTRPGDSSFSALDVSGDVPMIVSTQVTNDGPVISGDINEIVLVRVDPGYGPDPAIPALARSSASSASPAASRSRRSHRTAGGRVSARTDHDMSLRPSIDPLGGDGPRAVPRLSQTPQTARVSATIASSDADDARGVLPPYGRCERSDP